MEARWAGQEAGAPQGISPTLASVHTAETCRQTETREAASGSSMSSPTDHTITLLQCEGEGDLGMTKAERQIPFTAQ